MLPPPPGKGKVGKISTFADLTLTDKLGVFNVSFNAANASCDGSVCQDPVPMLLAVLYAFRKAEELANA